MKLEYIGDCDAVFVPEHDEYLDISPGDIVDFADDLAERLLEQETNWCKPRHAPRRKVAERKAAIAANPPAPRVDAVDTPEGEIVHGD
jgi:hypothetical protein